MILFKGWIFGIALFFLGIFPAFSQSSKESQILDVRGDKTFYDPERNQIKIEGNVSFLFSDDKDGGKLHTEKLTILGPKKDDTLILGEPKNQFCGKNFRVEADLMTIFIEQNLLKFRGNVGIDYRFISLNADEFTVNRKTYEFSATSKNRDKPVTVSYISAIDQVSEVENFFTMECKEVLKRKKFPFDFLVSAQNIRWDPRSRSLTLTDSPKITQKNQNTVLSADRFKVFLDSKFNPKLVQADGNFKLVRGSQIATSQEAGIDFSKSMITMKRNVKLFSGDVFKLSTDIIQIPLNRKVRAVRSPNRTINISVRP